MLYTSTGCTASCSNTAWLEDRLLIVGTWSDWYPGSSCWVKAAQGYQSATNGASCFIRDASNMPIVVDYTAFRYTTYSFTIQMLENGQTPTKNNNIGPHGGIKICNKDGTRQTRGSSPEFRFIDRTSDFGYTPDTLRWIRTDDFAYATAEMRSVSEGLWPDAPRVWEIVMEWDGASYKLVSWKVDGTAIPGNAGRVTGCGADTSAAGQVRVWSYSRHDTFKVKDFTITQGGSLAVAAAAFASANNELEANCKTQCRQQWEE